MTAQERLEIVTREIEEAGGRITTVDALAHPDDPHEVVAHRVTASASTPAIHAAVRTVLAAHHVPIEGLVPWQDPDNDVEGAEE